MSNKAVSITLLAGILLILVTGVVSAADLAPSIPILKWPLQGTLTERTILLDFGADWVWGECPAGVAKKHVGIDVSATVGEDVYAPEAGVVKKRLYHAKWKYGVTIEHSGFTTVCWHIDPLVDEGDSVTRGQVIGTIANIAPVPNHLHFGVRVGTYSDISNRGALPQDDCGGDDGFPEYFLDPQTLVYSEQAIWYVDDTWIRFTGTAVATWFYGPKMCNLGARAYTGFVWTGCGTPSSGTCHSENTVFFDGTGGVTLQLGGYSLSLFRCINDGDGDHRLYTGGELLIKQGGNIVLILKDSRFNMDVDYLTNTMTGSGWATLDMDAGDESLRNEFNPHGAEQMELVFNGWNPVIQGVCGEYGFDVTFRPTEYKENILSQPVSNIGVLDFPDAKVSLNVREFTPGGQNNDMNDFIANQIMTDPGGAPPDGIEVISPYCYWELGTVLSSITADITFDLTEIPGTQTPANIRILRRENADDSWEIYEDQELVDDTHIRANGVTNFSEWGIGFQDMIFQVGDLYGADFAPPQTGTSMYGF